MRSSTLRSWPPLAAGADAAALAGAEAEAGAEVCANAPLIATAEASSTSVFFIETPDVYSNWDKAHMASGPPCVSHSDARRPAAQFAVGAISITISLQCGSCATNAYNRNEQEIAGG